MNDFVAFPKIPRLNRTIIVTEKIDGTNAQVIVEADGTVRAGSRNRFITPEADNYGFAAWVKQNEEQLRQLGVGRHFGEWWGLGIQRGYGLHERRFSLFNSDKWSTEKGKRPACCHVVPLLYHGMFHGLVANQLIDSLRASGSQAAPGFMHPEGIIVYHTAGGNYWKATLEKDQEHKGSAA